MASRPISPTEPTKKHILPNPHPYAIKTTSSGLLSGSSSSPHYTNHIKHHYIPAPPSRSTTGKVRHRHSSSMSAVEGEVHIMATPAPLPTPPSTLAVSTDNPSESPKDPNGQKLTHRARRAETMPSSTIEPITEHHSEDQESKYNYDRDSKPTLYPGLPPNPKQWNTGELITYLETSLDRNDGTDTPSDDTTVVEIVNYVRTCCLTGRELLRFTDDDLVGTPLSDAQRAQLLERSHTLRTDVLRGRIYVDSYHSQDISDNSKDIYSFSARAASIRGASASADDLCSLADNDTRAGADAFPPSPAMTLHRSNTVFEASAQRYRDLARMRMRRRGRVKGLVETWERARTSGGDLSASEEESVCGSDADVESESSLEADHSPDHSSDVPSEDPHDSPPRDVCSTVGDSADLPQGPLSLTPPPPYTHVFVSCTADEEEPSIEELLSSSSNVPLKGAQAWEADFGLGETVKRIPVSLDTVMDSPRSSSIEKSTTHSPKDNDQRTGITLVQPKSKRSSVRGSTGRRDKNPKTQNRVVTAIFTGSLSEGVSQNICNEVKLADDGQYASGAHDGVRSKVQASLDPQKNCDSAIRALEESITTTRAQLDAFRVRLEQVEADTTSQEAEIRRAQYSDVHRTLETKQRRLEASVQTSVETELPIFTDAKNGDVPDVWEAISLSDITRAIVAKAMQWFFPHERMSVHTHDNDGQPLVRVGSRPGENDEHPSPAKRGGRLTLARMSCGIFLVSFAICAAVLRRMGFGRWVRRP